MIYIATASGRTPICITQAKIIYKGVNMWYGKGFNDGDGEAMEKQPDIVYVPGVTIGPAVTIDQKNVVICGSTQVFKEHKEERCCKCGQIIYEEDDE